MSTNRKLKWMAIAAIAFGVLTVVSGGRALFGSLETRASLGNAVSFVLWFNFLAGFIYILTGVGSLLHKRWAIFASLCLAASTGLIFAALGMHILGGGEFEVRTIMALTIRLFFWTTVSIVSIRDENS